MVKPLTGPTSVRKKGARTPPVITHPEGEGAYSAPDLKLSLLHQVNNFLCIRMLK
jgi:hypothetical protein